MNTKIQTNKGSALPIIIGIIVIVIIAVMLMNNGSENEQDAMMHSGDDGQMQVDEEMQEDEKEEMGTEASVGGEANLDTAPEGTQSGSYEEYSPEKIAMAQNGDVVLFFHASWCPSCRVLEKAIMDNADDLPADLTILKVDYDAETELKEKHGVRLQHSFVQVDADGNAIAKWTGGATLDDVLKNVK